METCRMLGVVLLCVCVLCVHVRAARDASASADEFGANGPEPAANADLVDALEALLVRMHNTEKRGSIPLCGMGDRCAMKFGPRIGKLCDCGRAANCNSYLLKCI